jgi:hypothetical protein
MRPAQPRKTSDRAGNRGSQAKGGKARQKSQRATNRTGSNHRQATPKTSARAGGTQTRSSQKRKRQPQNLAHGSRRVSGPEKRRKSSKSRG